MVFIILTGRKFFPPSYKHVAAFSSLRRPLPFHLPQLAISSFLWASPGFLCPNTDWCITAFLCAGGFRLMLSAPGQVFMVP